MLVFFFLFLALNLFLLQRRLYYRLWKKRLSVSVSFADERTQEGAGNTVVERVENRSIIPIHVLFIKYTLLRSYSPLSDGGGRREVTFKGGIGGRKIKERRYTIEGLRRGFYTISTIEASGHDIFLSTEYESTFHSLSSFFVFPRRTESRSFDLAYRELLGTILSKRRKNEDPFELRGIRDYMTHDSMRIVNWKASAKTGQLKVNEHDWTTDEGAAVVLDLRRGTEEEKETLISYAATIAERFLRRGINTSVITNARSSRDGTRIVSGSGSGRAHVNTIDEVLALIKITAVTHETPQDLLALFHPDNTTLLLITRTPEENEGCELFDAVICIESGKGAEGTTLIEVGGSV